MGTADTRSIPGFPTLLLVRPGAMLRSSMGSLGGAHRMNETRGALEDLVLERQALV